MKRPALLVLSALLVVLAGVACSKSSPPEGSLGNDLRTLPGAGAGRAGVPDDGVKPVVVAPLPPKPVAKTGIPDDSIKPVAAPQPLPTVAR